MLTAITRDVSPSINDCELTHQERRPIDVELARRQHEGYRACLTRMGLHVISLPAEPDLPDAVFVEDPALVLDEIAVITRPGAPSRRAEGASLANALEIYRPIEWMMEPATLEGGDVLRLGRTLIVGLSSRTNPSGLVQLRDILDPHGYEVRGVELHDCLHLKSACCALGPERVLVNPRWLDPAALGAVDALVVPDEEPRAANVLAIGEQVLLPAAHPRTAELLARHRFTVLTVDNSELLKAESGVTCSSLVFEA